MADTKNAAKGKTKGKDKGKPSQAEPEVRDHLTIHGYNVLYDLKYPYREQFCNVMYDMIIEEYD